MGTDLGVCISSEQILLLLNIVKQLDIAHGAGYDPIKDRSYLRIDHNDKHMLFYAWQVVIIETKQQECPKNFRPQISEPEKEH